MSEESNPAVVEFGRLGERRVARPAPRSYRPKKGKR